jgi:hypothetical protein
MRVRPTSNLVATRNGVAKSQVVVIRAQLGCVYRHKLSPEALSLAELWAITLFNVSSVNRKES